MITHRYTSASLHRRPARRSIRQTTRTAVSFGEPRLRYNPKMFFGFWPESTQTAADEAASADDAEPWHFDPELLTTQFAEVVLGWPDPVIASIDQVPLFPYWASFEVRPSRQQPTITITAAQLAGETGWVIIRVSSPIQSLRSGYSAQGPITIGFDRQGATTVDVTVGIGQAKYSQSTDDLDEVNFVLEEPVISPSYFLILFKDDGGAVFAANSGNLGDSPLFATTG